jgi:peroxiredoxin
MFKSKWFYSVLAVILILPVVAAGVMFVLPDKPWDSSPKKMNGITVFEEHITEHPGFYSAGNMLDIFTKVDVTRLMQKDVMGTFKNEGATFVKASPIGEAMPAFELSTVAGGRLNSADLRGKIVAFMFVAMTCPPARMQVARWTELRKKYDSDDVEMFVIYSRERHAGEPGYRDFKQPTTSAEKMRYATMMAQLTDMTVAVDGIGLDTLQQYGLVPNASFVVDKAGNLVFKAQWSDSKKVEQVIDTLLEGYQLADPVSQL